VATGDSAAGMKRILVADGLCVLLLFALGAALRLPLVPLLDVSSDATDPIVGALQILWSWNPFLTDTPRFGYGRALSYVPLVIGSEDGLSTVAARRALVQALLAPVTYLAMRVLLSRQAFRPSLLLGPLFAALLLVVNQDLLQNLIWGHHGYFGPDWAALLLLGFAGLLVGDRLRLWAALSGLSLAMCVMNHPYAITAVVVPAVAWRSARRNSDPARARAALVALAVAVLAVLPHLAYLLLSPGSNLSGDLLESVATASVLGPSWPWQVISGLFSNLATPEAVLFGAALLLALAHRPLGRLLPLSGDLQRVLRPLALSTAAVLVGLLILGLVSRQVHNWHWRMLLPFGTACLGTVLAWLGSVLEPGPRDGRRPRRPTFAVALLCLGLLLGLMSHAFRAGVDAYSKPAEGPRESLLQLVQAERVSALLEASAEAGPWTLVAYGVPPERSYARTLPVALDRVLRPGSKVSFAGTRSEWLQGPTLFYFEGPGSWIDAVAVGGAAVDAATLWRGVESLVLRTDSPAAALGLGVALCGASGGAPLVADSPRDSLALLAAAGLMDGSLVGEPIQDPSPCIRSNR